MDFTGMLTDERNARVQAEAVQKALAEHLERIRLHVVSIAKTAKIEIIGEEPLTNLCMKIEEKIARAKLPEDAS